MFLNKAKYLEYIRDPEQIIVMRKILDKIEKVLKNHEVVYSDFLDPYQRRLSYSILNRFSDLNYFEEGGLEEAERKSIIIYPFYLNKEDIENPIGSIEITGNFRRRLSHRDYLGSILGLGIKREKIGDIYLHDDFAQIVLHRDILDFVKLHLNKVGNQNVYVEEISLDEIKQGVTEYIEKNITVSSLRVDNVISTVYNISRSKCLMYFNQNRVKVNWEPIRQPFHLADETDLISVKGEGRFLIYKNLGKTKKGRHKLIIKIYV
ncbi:RNA-binding protein YlmH, contains S4-like domain [Caloranaerobacter azorensis DSM 13643]|uniref:RNA-binding protein YlmH, contains S4-like domain n=1 Tax=Caloranaerobacter azorensis DSM 13643 TaxID=1121264 RepID=A0A1M5V260_9FIRM|nr:YlmH/Sll1252 family protein [Caloranaerobacter azorensis]SHH69377.1 RNA-binding protein YlmH, contains S4-like domain [Caloranaerobacter azorensis DSM 13643]